MTSSSLSEAVTQHGVAINQWLTENTPLLAAIREHIDNHPGGGGSNETYPEWQSDLDNDIVKGSNGKFYVSPINYTGYSSPYDPTQNGEPYWYGSFDTALEAEARYAREARLQIKSTWPDQTKTIWVNQAVGDDSNGGTHRETDALKSIFKAIAVGRKYPNVKIYVHGNYSFELGDDDNGEHISANQHVTIEHSPYLADKDLELGLIAPTTAGYENHRYFQQIKVHQGAFLGIKGFNIVFPEMPAGATPIGSQAFIETNGYAAHSSVKIYSCNIDHSGSKHGSMFNIDNEMLIFSVWAGTHNNMAGNWIDGVSAGTSSSSVSGILTDLTTL